MPYDQNRSGQTISFTMTSLLSGILQTGISGAISGRKSIDGGVTVLISGYVGEVSGGLFTFYGHDFDFNGRQIGFLFSASGCNAVCASIATMGNVSGKVYPASGLNAVVPIASISGAIVNSGLFVSVPIASISGVIANSGLFVTVPKATISGVIANSGLRILGPVEVNSIQDSVITAGVFDPSAKDGLSGLNVIADVARWRNVVPNVLLASGRVDAAFSLRTGVAVSGTASTVQLDAGAPSGVSGVYNNAIISIIGGSGAGESRMIRFYSASGIATVSPPFEVAPFANSIFTITPTTFPTSGTVHPISGAFATVPIASLSGVIANSGIFAAVPIASLSGVIANSGLFVTVPKATISGVIANSGLNVTATATVDPATISGAFVTVPIATISGAVGNSGQFVTVPTATLSGVVANSGLFVTATVAPPASGTLFLASGQATYLYSGQNVIVASGQGVNVTAINGTAVTPGVVDANVVTWSGTPVDVGPNAFPLVEALSGSVFPASGMTAVVTTASISGVFATVPIASISGAVGNSGQFVTVPIASLSGVIANSGIFAASTVLSGTSYLASGSIFGTTFASGVTSVVMPQGNLKVDMSGITGEAARSPLNAFRKLINKWDTSSSSGVLTVFKENDSTVGYTQNITATSGAAPITSLDTN